MVSNYLHNYPGKVIDQKARAFAEWYFIAVTRCAPLRTNIEIQFSHEIKWISPCEKQM